MIISKKKYKTMQQEIADLLQQCTDLSTVNVTIQAAYEQIVKDNNELLAQIDKIQKQHSVATDCIGDISEALNSISENVRLNAIKQIRNRVQSYYDNIVATKE